MVSKTELDDPRAEAAVQWMVEMSSGDVTPLQQQHFEAWLGADPLNEAAWRKLCDGLTPFGVVSQRPLPPGKLARRVLQAQSTRRKILTGLAGVVGVGALGVTVTDRYLPLHGLLADHFTSTGNRKHVQLGDDSEVVLAPRTAINVAYTDTERGIQLLDGEILLRVRARQAPFTAAAGEITLTTAEGSFVLSKRGDLIAVTGIDGVAHLGQSVSVQRNEKIVYADNRFEREAADADVVAAWVDGLLIARNRTVASVIEDIQPYFPGVIRVDPAIGHLRVTAVLKLAEPSVAVDTLADSLGLRVRRISPYWISIGPRSA